MSIWSYLPYDILELVFQYLEQNIHRSVYSAQFTTVLSNDMFQCQLTCKNWSSLARQKIYKRIILNGIQQLKLFSNTIQNSDVGQLVEFIHLQLEEEETETREALLVNIRHIATFCTFLKTLSMDSNDFQDIWKLIKDERSKGNFTRLQVIPLVKDQASENISNYNDAAISLQQTLRELVIYSNNTLLDESKSRHFPNATTVFFKLDDFIDTCFINKHLECLSSVTKVELDLENCRLNQDQVGSEFPTYISPQVKQISVKKYYYSNRISDYIIKSFPNLLKMTVTVKNISYNQVPMSTNEAIRFLEHLLSIPELSVSCIPVENQNDVMLGLHNNNNRSIKKLRVVYFHMPSPTSFLSVATRPNEKEKIDIYVIHKANIPPLLPRIGIIEKSGKDLQYLEIDMGLGLFGGIHMTPGSDDNVTLSGILQQCPHLLGICIRNTVLNTFDTYIQLKNRIEIRDHLSCTNSLFHLSFLPNLSFCVSYIFLFTLNNCRFMDEIPRVSIREIIMPHTVFENIAYDDRELTDKIYLKLSKTINNTVSWYTAENFSITDCTEKEYEDSLENQDTFSLFIQCKNVAKINISFSRLNVVLRT